VTEELAILEGDEKIRTGDNTWAEIIFEGDSKVKVYPNTELFLKEVTERVSEGVLSKKLVLSIFLGKIVSDAKGSSNFYINANACAAKVNGTTMTEVSPSGATFIAVLEGVANMTDKEGKTVVISSRQQIMVTPQKPLPEPTKIDAKLLNELTVEKEEIQKIESFEQARREVLQSLPPYRPMVIHEKFKSEMARPEWQEMMRKVEEMKKRHEQKITKKAPKPETASKTMAVGKSVNYRGIEFSIAAAEIREEYENRRSPENKAFLILKMGAKNNSSERAFAFYQEEVRLTGEAGETIPLEDYKMKTSFDPKAESDGHLLFVIPKENTKFKLQFGKKSLPKAELELDLVEKGKGKA
jgi:hypothetical protein